MMIKEIVLKEQLMFDIKSKLFDWGIIDKQSLRDTLKNELINKACNDIANAILTKLKEKEMILFEGKNIRVIAKAEDDDFSGVSNDN